jgi:hypothetical protein
MIAFKVHSFLKYMHSNNSSGQIAQSNKLARDFGILIATVVSCLSAYKYYIQSWTLMYFSCGLLLSIGFLAIGFIKPSLLRFPLRLWMRLGDLMGKVVSPLILGIIFFLMITPIAILTRLLGRDFLSLKRVDTHSFWKQRDLERQPSKSFNTQF